MARGARRAKSKLAGSIELFGSSQITLLPGRGEISTLISARLINNYGNIVKDLSRTQLGYDILKLINKHIEDNSDEAIYGLLVDTLEYLNNQSISLELTKFWFGLQFLILMGHSPNLSVDMADDIDKYAFNLDNMTFLSDENGPFNKNHIKILRLAISNNPVQLSKITNINQLIDSNLNFTRMMLISTGFNPI
jgi:DNA repair protein RecO